MSGEIHNTRTQVTVTDNTLTLEHFRELTTGRNVNKGTLKLVKDKNTGNITGLRCSKHHIWRTIHNPKVSKADAEALKSTLKDILGKELEKIFSKPEFENLPQSRLNALAEKRIAILDRFGEKMTIMNKDPETKKVILNGVQRTTIEKIIERMDTLKKLSADNLLNYDTAALFRLLDNKGAPKPDDARLYDTQADKRENVRKDANLAMLDATLDDLNNAGNTLIRTCYADLTHDRDKFNTALFSNNVTTIYLDENGDLAFDPDAYDAEIREDFKKLIGAVALSGDNMKLNKDLGGDLTEETINEALSTFTKKLTARNKEIAGADRDKAKSEIPALTKDIGGSLTKVTNPQVLLKAATALLFKGDYRLAKFSKMRPGTESYNAKLQNTLSDIASILKRNNSSLELEFKEEFNKKYNEDERAYTGVLKLKEGADVKKIQKDIGILLSALTGQDIVVNDTTINAEIRSSMRMAFFYGTSFDTKDKGARVTQALQEFRAILDNADAEPMFDANEDKPMRGVASYNANKAANEAMHVHNQPKKITNLIKDMGKALGKVNDRAVLLKAANVLLKKGDHGLLNVANMPRGEKYVDGMRVCRNRLTEAFKQNKCSLEFTITGSLVAKANADIATIKKDIAKLLSALTNCDIEGYDVGNKENLRKAFGYTTYDSIYGQGHMPSALSAFSEVLASAIDGDYNPIPMNEDDGDEGYNLLPKEEGVKAKDYNPIPMNEDNGDEGYNLLPKEEGVKAKDYNPIPMNED